MMETVFKGYSNTFSIQVFEDGEPMDFSAITRMTVGLKGLGVVVDTDDNTDALDWSAGNGVLVFSLGEIELPAGAYNASIVVFDTAHPNGQVLIHEGSSLLQVTIIDDTANTIPMVRVSEWVTPGVPEIIVGDSFEYTITLLEGVTPVPFDFSTATSVQVAVVDKDHSKALTDSEEQSSDTPGANWAIGVLALHLSKQTTARIATYFSSAKQVVVEIQVVIDEKEYTWFAKAKAIPGYVK